jgi:tRNA threonylcarbamoyladenosine biosynthesis protein TsaB
VVKTVLSKAGVLQKDLDAIAVSVGPGSYSGIRIGMATAAGLARALSIPCLGVSALDAISLSATIEGKFVAAAGVGKRHIGSSSFDLTTKGRSSLSEYAMQTDEEFGLLLRSLGDASILCDQSVTSRVRTVAPHHVAVSESQNTVAELVGMFAFGHPEGTSLRPIYLRDQAGASGQPVIQP